MTKLEVLTYPNKFLQQPTKPVENIDEVIQKLVADMAETMYEAPGVGLAAIQVGSDKQVLVYDEKPAENDRRYGVIINPRIIETEGIIISENEGCLSVPDFRSDVKRAARIVVEGVDRDGKSLRCEADGFLAIVLQHEIDHLNGTLFIDRISALKRELYKRRMKKMLREK
ncbi:MAG: peptide deformylase [Desulfobacterales bacterium]|jgi:peptide deformylase|nr:peptide deformylase [Desulfobacterales bacterium]